MVDVVFLLLGNFRLGGDGRGFLDEGARIRQAHDVLGLVEFGLLCGDDVIGAEEPTGLDTEELHRTRRRIGPQAVQGADAVAVLVDDLVVDHLFERITRDFFEGFHDGPTSFESWGLGRWRNAPASAARMLFQQLSRASTRGRMYGGRRL